MQLFHKIPSGLANNVDTDETAPSGSLIWVCTVCIGHFVKNFGVQNLGHLPKCNQIDIFFSHIATQKGCLGFSLELIMLNTHSICFLT